MTPAETILAKTLLPTALDTAGFRERWGTRIHADALASARTTSERYLARLQATLADLARGDIGAARGREILIDELRGLGYDAERGGFPEAPVPAADAGTLRDLASRARLDLVLRTQLQSAQAMGQVARSEDPVVMELYPAYELVRGAYRVRPRGDWPQRWRAAGEAVGWQGAARGRMIALKTSPVWQALGEGAGGFRDTLGNPWPPFAWGSSHVWRDRNRDEAAEAGLLPAGEAA